MDIILPAAGLGTRLRPQTWSKPKPLVSVAGKPMLGHVLDSLMPLEPETLVFVTGYRGDQIESWVKDNYSIPSRYVEQPQMLGQTDAIQRAQDISRKDALILFPDMLFEADFSVLAESDADVVIFTKTVDDPSAYGVAELDADGLVTKLTEKPEVPVSNLAVIGIYYIRSMPDLYDSIEIQIERNISLKNEYFLADAIQLMIDDGKKVVTAPVDVWQDCGNEQALLESNRYMLGKLDSSQPAVASSQIIQPSFVHETATIERSIIGPFASIGAGSTVRGSVVSDSIVDDGATIENQVLDGSIIGQGAVISGNAKAINASDLTRVESA